MANSSGPLRHVQTPERLKALSDGVFSIALTLLIIDVVAVAKEVEEGVALQHHLTDHWATGAAYLVGFLTIFVCWVNQHAVLEHVVRVDSTLVWVSGLQLVLVSAVPLPTALLAEHYGDSERDTVMFLYGFTFFLIAFSFWILSHVARKRSDIERMSDRLALVKLVHTYFVAVLWTILALFTLRFSLYLAFLLWALMFLVFAFPGQISHLTYHRLTSKVAKPAQ